MGKRFKGYCSIEASLVMPMVLFLYLLIILSALFLYCAGAISPIIYFCLANGGVAGCFYRMIQISKCECDLWSAET